MRHLLRRSLLAACCATLGTTGAFAQGVGINGTGASADASAMLDVASTTKGFLPPRMTAMQRAAIVSPATGLLVYQSDGTVGLYYNAGTPAAPSWQLAGGGAATGQWATSGANLYYTAGKVAIGQVPSAYALTILDPSAGLRVGVANPGGVVASYGGFGRFDIDANGIVAGRFTVLENGNVGIKNAAPTNLLSFASALGKKISLYHDATGGDYGLGIAGSRLQIYGGYSGADVAIGYDNLGTFVEKLAVKPTGAIAVSGNPGSPGQVLTSNGAGAAATWASPVSDAYDNTYQAVGAGGIPLEVDAGGAEAAIPGLSLTFNVTRSTAKALVQFSVAAFSGCFLCNGGTATIKLVLNGSAIGEFSRVLQQYTSENIVGCQLLTSLPPGTYTLELHIMCTAGAPVYTASQLGAGGAMMNSVLIAQVMQQ